MSNFNRHRSMLTTLVIVSIACGPSFEESFERIKVLKANVTENPSDMVSLGELLRLASDTDGNRIVRTNAVIALSSSGSHSNDDQQRKVVPALIGLLVDDSIQSVRREAATSLGSFGAKASEAVPALVLAIRRERGKDVALYAAEALGRINARADIAVPALIELVRPGLLGGGMELIALRSFGQGAKEAIPRLEGVLVSEDVEYSCEAARTLVVLDPRNQNLVKSLTQLYSVANPEQRFLVVDVIADAIGAGSDVESKLRSILAQAAVDMTSSPGTVELAEEALSKP